MSQPQCEYERPFTKRIDSRLAGFEMEPRPRGEPCTLRFPRCSISFVREDQYIGAETMTKVEHEDELEGQEQEVAPPMFQAELTCRGAIRQMLMEVQQVLPAALIKRCDVDLTEEGQWDQFVPAGLVERIVQGAAGGGSYACDVWMDVEVTRVYSEAAELLLLCERIAMETSDDSARPRAPGAEGDACPICMEEMAHGAVTGLPGCSHAFHRDCILQWFGKAPTCPYCRHDIVDACIVDE